MKNIHNFTFKGAVYKDGILFRSYEFSLDHILKNDASAALAARGYFEALKEEIKHA